MASPKARTLARTLSSIKADKAIVLTMDFLEEARSGLINKKILFKRKEKPPSEEDIDLLFNSAIIPSVTYIIREIIDYLVETYSESIIESDEGPLLSPSKQEANLAFFCDDAAYLIRDIYKMIDPMVDVVDSECKNCSKMCSEILEGEEIDLCRFLYNRECTYIYFLTDY